MEPTRKREGPKPFASPLYALGVGLLAVLSSRELAADGILVGPKFYKERAYKGSVEEESQEAIIIFHVGDEKRSATEDLILKVSVKGEVTNFGWVIPFPNEPKAAREDAKLFQELFAYVEARKHQLRQPKKGKGTGGMLGTAEPQEKVEVISRQIVGTYDVAVVREKQAGALNQWLDKEGFQTLDNADDVIGFYRKKGYVFACVKVKDAALSEDEPVDLHPLRFSFETGGRDGIYYPMKITGLQKESFDINLYVLYRFWLNDRLSKYGYLHRGFSRNYRDWDSPKCVANGGKAYSDPTSDPFLQSMAGKIPTVTKLLQKLHPGEKYYLTNIRMLRARPKDIRDWSDDLWLFPYYIDKKFVPCDARPGGIAAAAWED